VARNWESLPRNNNSLAVPCVVAGIESIRGGDCGTSAGFFPAILVRIAESYALKLAIELILKIVPAKHSMQPLSELFAGTFHKLLCPIRQLIFSEFPTLDSQKSGNSAPVEAEPGGYQASSV
jgi:hypothetical protein